MKFIISTVLFLAIFVLLRANSAQARTCNTCRECSGGTDESQEPANTPTCKCDSNCILFGDCCESSIDLSSCQADNAGPSATDVEFVCRSVYPDSRIEPLAGESFWMVSSCPSSWSTSTDSQAAIRDSCVSQAMSGSLPPITDLSTGTVYSNEFCAICNGVENLLAWQPNLACTPYVYQQLAILRNDVQALLRMDPTIFQTQCQACSYQVPNLNSISRPRACFNAISTCLNRTHLETITRMQLSQDSYNSMMDSCVNGPYDLVTTEPGSLFRNQNCALCNGDELNICFTSPDSRIGIPAECAPVISTTQPPTAASAKPTTQPPATAASAKPPPDGATTEPEPSVLPFVPPDPILPFVPPEPTELPFVPPGEFRPTGIDDGDEREVQGIPFTIALSNLGGGQVQVSIMSETVTVMVDCPDGQAALGLECRPTLCPQGFVESGGRCAFQIGNSTFDTSTECANDLVALNVSDFIVLDNNTLLYNDQVLTILEFDLNGRPIVCIRAPVFFDCPSGLVALNHSEFIDLGNDTIMYGDEVFMVIEYDALNRPIICPPNATTIIRNVTLYSYPEGYLILTYIGCSLSVIGSAFVLLTYGLFKVLRTLPSQILMNLSAAILANNLFIIIGGPITQAFPSIELCTTVAICLHFFFLAQFSWMTIMSFQMARTFYRARKLKMDSNHQRKVAFAVYFVIGWTIPLAITGISITLDFTTEHLVLYGVLEDGRLGSCWINHFESAIVSFIVPLAISLILNMILFVVVTVFVCIAARSSAKLDKNHNLQFFRLNTAVFSVTGLTWVFGFIALLAGTSWAWYPFIILNSTQGFVIFIAFLFTRRVFHLYRDFLCCHKPLDSTKGNKSTDSTSSNQHQQKVLSQSVTRISISV